MIFGIQIHKNFGTKNTNNNVIYGSKCITVYLCIAVYVNKQLCMVTQNININNIIKINNIFYIIIWLYKQIEFNKTDFIKY